MKARILQVIVSPSHILLCGLYQTLGDWISTLIIIIDEERRR